MLEVKLTISVDDLKELAGGGFSVEKIGDGELLKKWGPILAALIAALLKGLIPGLPLIPGLDVDSDPA